MIILEKKFRRHFCIWTLHIYVMLPWVWRFVCVFWFIASLCETLLRSAEDFWFITCFSLPFSSKVGKRSVHSRTHRVINYFRVSRILLKLRKTEVRRQVSLKSQLLFVIHNVASHTRSSTAHMLICSGNAIVMYWYGLCNSTFTRVKKMFFNT